MKPDLRISRHHQEVVNTTVNVLNESIDLGEETREKLKTALNKEFEGIRNVTFINGNLVIGIHRWPGQIGVPYYATVESHIWQNQSTLKPEMKKLLQSKTMVEIDQITPANDANHPGQFDKAS